MKPAQGRSGEWALYVVTFGKGFQPHLVKTIGLHGTPDAFCLRRCSDLVALPAGDENLGVEEVAAGMKFAIAFGQQVFVDPGEINASDAIARNCEQGGDKAGALGATGNTRAGKGPFV